MPPDPYVPVPGFPGGRPQMVNMGPLAPPPETSVIDRLVESLMTGTSKGFGSLEADPLGIDPQGEGTDFLNRIGVFGPGPLQKLNEGVIRPAVGAVDLGFRSLGAGLRGSTSYVAQLATEFGTDEF